MTEQSNLDAILSYLNPDTIESVVAYVVGIITAVGLAIGRVRRAIVEAIKKATTKEPPK